VGPLELLTPTALYIIGARLSRKVIKLTNFSPEVFLTLSKISWQINKSDYCKKAQATSKLMIDDKNWKLKLKT
jgi:hypothetical protein